MTIGSQNARQLGPGPLILKLGGSLIEAGRAARVLDLIACARRPVVIVPGGGRFADCVRREQAEHGYSDRAAHHMAILAMQQMAHLVMEMQPGLRPCETVAEFAQPSPNGQTPIWLPYAMTRDDRSIPMDWSITSDGLAARLAERLGSSAVVLLKSCSIPSDAALADLVADNIVDAEFPNIVARACLEWHVLGPGQEDRLAMLIGAPVTERKKTYG